MYRSIAECFNHLDTRGEQLRQLPIPSPIQTVQDIRNYVYLHDKLPSICTLKEEEDVIGTLKSTEY